MYKRIGMVMVGTALALTVTACGSDMNRATNELDRNTQGMRTQSTGHENNNFMGQNNNGARGNDNMNNYRGMNNNGGAHNDRGMVNGEGMVNEQGVVDDRDSNGQHRELLEQVRRVNGVNDATVFVNGNDIVVGLDLDDNNQGKQVERKVKQALQKSNKGYTVHVTSDAGMHTRIRQIQGQMIPMDGHPIRNMAKDIGTLLEDMGRTVTEPLR